jgi:hypothetical protein
MRRTRASSSLKFREVYMTVPVGLPPFPVTWAFFQYIYKSSVFEVEPDMLSPPFPHVPGLILGGTLIAWCTGFVLVVILKRIIIYRGRAK